MRSKPPSGPGTREHDWLEDRAPKLYLIGMIDDATSRMLARFVKHDSSAENLRLLQSYLGKNGRPVSFYTDKASLFAKLPKSRRGETAEKDAPPLSPTQIGRALKELAARFRSHYLVIAECQPRRNAVPAKTAKPRLRKIARRKSEWMKNFHLSKSASQTKTFTR